MNTVIENILSNDDELFNRVHAYGPGDGINRWMVTVEDATSIAAYGVRETVIDFPNAVNLTDLTTKANEYLAEVKDPAQEIVATYYFDTGLPTGDVLYAGEVVVYNGENVTYLSEDNVNQIRRGDKVRISSFDLGQTFTGYVEELDWSPGQVTIRLGRPAYNLLDVINGPEEEEERKKVALGLPIPLGFAAYTSNPGITVKVNPYTNSRAIGVEIYGSATQGFSPSRANLLSRGPGTTFYYNDFDDGATYYFLARAYDGNGDFSGFTDEVSAIGGAVQADIADGSIDIAKFATGIRPPRFVSDLPDVTVATGWELGDVVVYDDGNGLKLYTLISETGTPSVDWKLTVNADDLDGQIGADQIVANSITAGQISAGAIGANEIASRAIVANKLAVGDFTNSALNPGVEDDDLSFFQLNNGAGVLSHSSASSNNGSYSLRYDHSSGTLTSEYIGMGGTAGSPLGNMRVKSGDKFFFEFYYRDGLSAPTGNVRIYAQERDETGAFLGDATLTNLVGADSAGVITSRSTAWRRVAADVEATNSATSYIWLSVYFTNISVGQYAFMDDFTIRRKSDGQLLVDGEVTADKISANAVTTGKLAAGHIIIDDGAGGDGDADRLRVNTTAGGGGTDQVVLGNISTETGGLASWGLWGALGTGVFIEGAPRLIAVIEALSVEGGSNYGLVSPGDTAEESHTEPMTINGSSSFTVPAGKKWVAIHTIYDSAYLGTADAWAEGNRSQSYVRALDSGGSPQAVEFPADTYTNLSFFTSKKVVALRSTTVDAFFGYLLNAYIVIIEVDA